jgi:hypothetical protein
MGNRWLLFLGVSGLLSLGCTGAPRQLEPRLPPPRITPEIALPAAPIPSGFGRVVISTTDTAMNVSARADTSFIPPGATVAPTRSGDLCTSPCVIDLPQGKYKLFMTGLARDLNHGDADELLVQPGVNYYVRAPGKFEPPEWIPVVPTILVILGTGLLAGGVAVAADHSNSSRAIGGAMMASGLSIGIVGGVMSYNKSRGTMQQGASTVWTVAAP